MVTTPYMFLGLKRIDVTEAGASDIICLAGIENIVLGETTAEGESPIARSRGPRS